MSYFLILVIFYQPIYWMGRSLYNQITKNTTDSTEYITKARAWFTTLWTLVNPRAV